MLLKMQSWICECQNLKISSRTFLAKIPGKMTGHSGSNKKYCWQPLRKVIRDEPYKISSYGEKYLKRQLFILLETFLLLSGQYFIVTTFLSEAGAGLYPSFVSPWPEITSSLLCMCRKLQSSIHGSNLILISISYMLYIHTKDYVNCSSNFIVAIVFSKWVKKQCGTVFVNIIKQNTLS